MTGWWYTYPSEKYYESQLGWFFPIYGKIFKNMFQTTNQMIYKPIVRISNMAWMNINNCNIFWPWSIWECQRQNHHNPTCWCLMVNVCWLRGQTKNIIRVCHTLSDSGMIIRHLMIKIMMLIITNPIIIFIRIRRFYLRYHWCFIEMGYPLKNHWFVRHNGVPHSMDYEIIWNYDHPFTRNLAVGQTLLDQTYPILGKSDPLTLTVREKLYKCDPQIWNSLVKFICLMMFDGYTPFMDHMFYYSWLKFIC